MLSGFSGMYAKKIRLGCAVYSLLNTEFALIVVTMNLHIQIDMAKIADFCRKWQITEFALFGSVLRDDFRPDSDVDVLVTFAPEAGWDLMDLIDARDELSEMFGRRVDLVEKVALRNPFRKHAILTSKEILYAA